MTHAMHEHDARAQAAEYVEAQSEAIEPVFAAMPVPLAGLAMPADSAIRRRVSVRGRHASFGAGETLEDPPPTAFDDDFEALIKTVDDTTATAFAQVVNRPLFTGLGELVEASGYLALWVNKMKDAVKAGYAAGLSAAQFGYAIETLTTHLLGASAAGWALTYQVAAGPTRPDIVATKNGRTVWLDLTADSSHSAAHIYTSKSWHKRNVCQYEHAEIVYTPCTSPVMVQMLANAKLEVDGKPKEGKVDASALTAEIAAAKKRLQAALNRWASEYGTKLVEETKKVSDFGTVLANRDELARISVYKWLNKTFGLCLDTTKEHEGDEDYARYGVSSMRKRRNVGPWKGSGGKSRPSDRSHADDEDPTVARKARKKEQARRTEDASLAGSILLAMRVGLPARGFTIGNHSLARGIGFLTEQDEKAKKDAEKKPESHDVEMLA